MIVKRVLPGKETLCFPKEDRIIFTEGKRIRVKEGFENIVWHAIKDKKQPFTNSQGYVHNMSVYDIVIEPGDNISDKNPIQASTATRSRRNLLQEELPEEGDVPEFVRSKETKESEQSVKEDHMINENNSKNDISSEKKNISKKKD